MRILLSLFALCVATIRSEAATVVANLVDIPGSPLNANIKLRYLGGIQGVGNQTYAGWAATVTPVNGVATFTIVTGRYQVQIGQQPFVEIFIPDTDQTYNFNDLVTKPENFNAYGQARVDKDDSRSGYITEKVIPGSGISFTTNTASGVKTLLLNALFATTNIADRSVTDPKIEYAVSGKTSAAGTLTFDFNGSRRQTNSESGSLTIAFSNVPTNSVDRWFIAQFTPSTNLTLSWPTNSGAIPVTWVPNISAAVTAITGGTIREVAIGFVGNQILLADQYAVFPSNPTITDFTLAQHTHASAIGGGQLSEQALFLGDNTTNNASGSRHGFLPKLSTSQTDVLRGDGTFGSPVVTIFDISASGSTVSTSPVTLYSLPLATDTSYMFTVWANAGGATNTGGYRRDAAFRRGAGSASLVGTNSVTSIETTGALECGFSVSGNNAIFAAAGVSDENLTWALKGFYLATANAPLSFRLRTEDGEYIRTEGGDYINIEH